MYKNTVRINEIGHVIHTYLKKFKQGVNILRNKDDKSTVYSANFHFYINARYQFL